ncbi:MAG TPA: hypothetical protein VK564_01280 [Thermodesulfobacteriota bacterium]|nr:hypothetical protein [Thermodesulfobacteriota bacterium]
MTISISKQTWVFAVINKGDEDERLTGFQDKNGGVFIPVLKTNKEAEIFLDTIPWEPGRRYEVQSIIFEDVLKYARENGSLVYLVNKKGEILEREIPEPIQ